jgi:hypothetical protein
VINTMLTMLTDNRTYVYEKEYPGAVNLLF